MDKNRRIEKVIFFNNKSDVDEYLRNTAKMPSLAGRDLCIAMTPSVYSCLKENGLEAENTLPYFSNQSHKRALEKSKELVDWLRQNSDFVDLGLGVRDSLKESFILYTRLAIHNYLWTTEIILNAIQEHRPKALAASCLKRSVVSGIYLEPDEKYLASITQTISEIKKMKFIDVSGKEIGKIRLFASRIKKEAVLLLRFVRSYLSFAIWERISRAKSFLKGKNPILFTTDNRMDRCLKELYDQKIDNHFCFLKTSLSYAYHAPFCTKLIKNLSSPNALEQKELFRGLEKKILDQKELFSYRDIPLGNFVVQKLRAGIFDYILGQVLWIWRLNKTIDSLSPVAVFSPGDHRSDIMLAELCREKGIESLLISHGSHVRPKNEYESIEWGEHGHSFLRSHFSSFALQSPLAEGYLDAFPSPAKIIKTGPVVWGREVNRERSRRPLEKLLNGKFDPSKIRVILHAGTPKASYTLRFQVYETSDEYIQSVRELSEATQGIPNTVLIVKFRPQSEISESEIGIDDFKKLVNFSDRVILSTNESFSDILGMSDLLVSYSSTTIEESLYNKIPVLLYGGGGRYQHVDAYQVNAGVPVEKNAVYYARGKEDLKYALQEILRLQIKNNKYYNLFDPYVYKPNERVSLVKCLKKVI